ncbi:hypothetical protein FS837_005645 [Tulasnella sp. UAMH 9824]|nr:hypothetical protein FS837_005645 [Tulasnella sp. UAMH 9824]
MVSQNHRDEYDFWAGDFPSDGNARLSHRETEGVAPFLTIYIQTAVPSSLNEDHHAYNAIDTSPAHLHDGPTFNSNFASQHPDLLSGVGTPASSRDDYELHFGTHPPVAPALPSPPSPPPLEFDEIINILALAPNEASGPSLMMQGSFAPTADPSSPIPVPGPAPVQIPTFPQANHSPFGGPSMSVSLPYRLHSSQVPMYPDVHRARSGSYAGPMQSPYHHSAHPSAFHSTPNGTFVVPFQDLAPGPSRVTSPPSGPIQQVIHFDLDNPQHRDSPVPPTIQQSTIPIPASPSDSSFGSSPTLSPASSTSSLANPPSPTATRTETFRWRLNSQESQGWRCDCNTKAKKKKRHLESCPRNPSKPTIKCPCCSQIFVGGSRKSALKKHMLNFHKDKVHLLKKYKG